MTLSEAQLTEIIKIALARYANKPFGRVSFNQKPEGIEVQFHDQSYKRPEEPQRGDVNADLPTISMPLGFGSGIDFGGGASGGAGASGDW